MNNYTQNTARRKQELKTIAEIYFQSLRDKNFSAIPFDDNIMLRALLVPGEVNNPVHGKESVNMQWWQPLEPALDGIRINIFDHYINDSLTGIITEAEIILANPSVTLRVADRFTINNEGKIIEQENHFDASTLLNPT
jgi:hypothetical protein